MESVEFLLLTYLVCLSQYIMKWTANKKIRKLTKEVK